MFNVPIFIVARYTASNLFLTPQLKTKHNPTKKKKIYTMEETIRFTSSLLSLSSKSRSSILSPHFFS
jgi:hypothetical protein